MKRFTLTEEARFDYYDDYEFIHSYSPGAANRWESSMIEAFRHLGEWPQSGRIREEYAPPHIRFWVVGDCIILYDPDTDPLMIIAIVHGARELYTIFQGRKF